MAVSSKATEIGIAAIGRARIIISLAPHAAPQPLDLTHGVVRYVLTAGRSEARLPFGGVHSV